MLLILSLAGSCEIFSICFSLVSSVMDGCDSIEVALLLCSVCCLSKWSTSCSDSSMSKYMFALWSLFGWINLIMLHRFLFCLEVHLVHAFLGPGHFGGKSGPVLVLIFTVFSSFVVIGWKCN